LAKSARAAGLRLLKLIPLPALVCGKAFFEWESTGKETDNITITTTITNKKHLAFLLD